MKIRAASFVGALALCAPLTLAQNVRSELYVSSGLQRPIAICSAPGDMDRLFVADKIGRVRIVRNGVVQSPVFIDIAGMVDSDGEGGMLGMAMHPDFMSNGKFYLSYTTGTDQGDSIISQFTVSPPTADVADPATEQVIWGPLIGTSSGHKGGHIEFAPDGKLYFSIGNGYAGGSGPENRAQDPLSPWGKVLRFDVDIPYPHIPPDNPFVGDPNGLDEVWALGFRNPWRFGIDPQNGDLYVADVGQSTVEEVNFIPSGVGGLNYGWKCKEGGGCTPNGGCDCNDPNLIDPIVEYDHQNDGGVAIAGGVVYRGSEIPELFGHYLYADFGNDRVWAVKYENGQVVNEIELTDALQSTSGGNSLDSLVSFGTDAAGEIYIVEHFAGEIWRILPNCGVQNFCVTSPHSAGPGAVMASAGSTSVSSNNLYIGALNCPTFKPGIFFYGSTAIQVPFGDGFRCAGGFVYRLNPLVMTNSSGIAQHALDITNPPFAGAQITAGSRWNFQFWFRDPMGPGGTGFNLTDGLGALFCP